MNRFHSLAFGAILIFALHVPAQQTATAPGTADKGGQGQPAMQDEVPSSDDQLRILTVKLDLTVDQQAKIRPILQDLHDATVKISQDQSLSREDRLARVRPLRLKAHDQIREILNGEQKKELEQYMQGPHADMHGNLSGATSSPQPPQN
jgi:Spy/CpxP family protein refolding chaperone